jgi:hypothetical protein
MIWGVFRERVTSATAGLFEIPCIQENLGTAIRGGMGRFARSGAQFQQAKKTNASATAEK